ncbi:uncharacterized protein I303_101100 [Kwoniella dejecticola CBS 10117]|uniref:Uncharacterized protein n=1 Tax=Kwoniella dejecticola CBS 10117 TaxID=1296121 RepID=A0A1A6AGT6_9TREE|nr:uncharacterized protein I303_01104 [Kwoniella dejecticola CBS 10117]OBR89279.1 hypothetical protein I303_01104 [Kwoniella dejecticola CBS 10117]
MTICIVNVHDEVTTGQLEMNHWESYTAIPLANTLLNLAREGVQFISVAATETDAVITISWNNENWYNMCRGLDQYEGRGLINPQQPTDPVIPEEAVTVPDNETRGAKDPWTRPEIPGYAPAHPPKKSDGEEEKKDA